MKIFCNFINSAMLLKFFFYTYIIYHIFDTSFYNIILEVSQLTPRFVRSLDSISVVDPDVSHLLGGRGGRAWWAWSQGTGDSLRGIVKSPERRRLVGGGGGGASVQTRGRSTDQDTYSCWISLSNRHV